LPTKHSQQFRTLPNGHDRTFDCYSFVGLGNFFGTLGGGRRVKKKPLFFSFALKGVNQQKPDKLGVFGSSLGILGSSWYFGAPAVIKFFDLTNI